MFITEVGGGSDLSAYELGKKDSCFSKSQCAGQKQNSKDCYFIGEILTSVKLD